MILAITTGFFHSLRCHLYCDVMVAVVGNRHKQPKFLPWMRLFEFHIALIPLGKICIYSPSSNRGSPCGVIAKVLDWNLKITKLKFQPHYYVHFWTNTLGKGMNPLSSPSYLFCSSTRITLALNNTKSLIYY